MDCGVSDQCTNVYCSEDRISFPNDPCVRVNISWYYCFHSELMLLTSDDNDPCTSDWCDPVLGCIHQPMDCSSANSCTSGTCIAGNCVYNPKCDDGNPCTTDICSPGNVLSCSSTLIEGCFVNLGQNVGNYTGAVPRPIGSPIELNGANMVPPTTTSNKATAYFWLDSSNCTLIYNVELVQLQSNTYESGSHIYGPASVNTVGPVVATLPLGLSKQGQWNFCSTETNLQVNSLLFSKTYSGFIEWSLLHEYSFDQW